MDEQYLLSTPENIPIRYELAGVGSRFVAALLDFLIVLGVQLGLILLIWVAASIPALAPTIRRLIEWLTSGLVTIVVVINSVLFVGYPLAFELVWSGQTPGKRLAGIRVVQADGGPITPVAAVIRNVLRLVDFLPVYYIIGVVVMLADGKSRRLGDLAAGTICVKERRDVSIDSLTLPQTHSEPGPLRDAADDLGSLRRLTYEDYYLIKEFLARRDRLAPDATERLAEQIADRAAARLGVERGDEPAQAFLERLASALHGEPPMA